MHSAAKHKRNHLDIEPSRLPDPEGTFFSCVGWPGCYQTWYKLIIHISSRKRSRRRSMPVTKVLWFLDALAKNVRKGRSLVKEDTVGFAAKHRVWRETHAVKDESSICRVAKSGPVTSKSSMVRYKQEGSIPERVDIHLRLIEGVYNYDRLRTFGIV